MESKYIMELVDRLLLTAEENQKLRTQMNGLCELIRGIEREEAQYCLENCLYYHPNVDTSAIRNIMGWREEPETRRMVEELKKKLEERRLAREMAKGEMVISGVDEDDGG